MRVINGQWPCRFPEGLGGPLKARLNRRAAQQRAGKSGAAVWARRASSAPAARC